MSEAKQAPVFDVGNDLLTSVTAQLTCGTVATPEGKRLIATIRTTSATVTVFLGREDALGWVALLQNTINGMGPLVVPHGLPAHDPVLMARFGLNGGKPGGGQ